MGLDYIHKSAEAPHAIPIVLLHGAWHGAWCWDAGFMDRLVDRGFEVLAVSMRGHGDSGGSARFANLGQYAEDLGSAVDTIGRPPVVVGHSMGGLITQRFIAKRSVAGAVLLAAAGPSAPWRVTGNTARHHPWLLAKSTATLSLGPLVSDRSLVRDLFFTEDTPDELVGWTEERLMAESYVAYMDMFRGASPKKVTGVPMLVLGAERDEIFPPATVEKTAAAYGTTAEVFDGMGHDMMLDTGWEAVADRIAAWVADLPADQPTSE